MSARHPEWWMILLSSAAWVFLAVGSQTSHGQASGPGPRIAALAAMIVAMMLPLTAGRLREQARSTTSPCHRAAAAFVVGYLAVWVVAMFAIDAVWRLTLSAAGWTMAGGIVIAAAVLWEVASGKWRQVPHGHGGRKEAGSAGSGAAAGASCVAACWALMAACVAFAHTLPVMAAFFLVQLHGRYRRPASPALAALAVLGVCLVSLALRMAGHSHHPGS
jgi:predicted metal-binding membrane protein